MDIRDALETHEGRRLKPYRCSAGKKTIGVGHNIDAKGLPKDIESYLKASGCITNEMVDRLLVSDIEDAQRDAVRLWPNIMTFSNSQQVALVDFVFNVGYGTARTFVNTNLAINQRRWKDAAKGILGSKYAKQVGQRAEDIAAWLLEE